MDPERVEQAAAEAAGYGAGEPTAVVPVRLLDGVLRFVCAFSDPAGALRWLVVDEAGAAVTDVRVVHDAVELVAMCETAEETATAVAAEDALPLLRTARALAEEQGAEEAARAARVTAEALEELARPPDGVRVAETAYLDEMAALARAVGDRYDLLQEAAGHVTMRLSGAPGDPLEGLARALWDAVRVLARDGAPDRFAETIEGAMPAAQALAVDVGDHYVVPLDPDPAVPADGGGS